MTTEPMTINVELGLTLDTPVDYRHRQVGEEEWATRPVSLIEAILDRAALHLVDQLAKAPTYRGWKEVVHDRILSAIDERVTPILDEAFAAPLPLTNGFGEPTGKTTTLRELIVAEAHKQLKVNAGRLDGKTPLMKVLEEVTERALTADLKAEVDAAKEQLRAAMKDAAAAVLGSAMAKAQGL